MLSAWPWVNLDGLSVFQQHIEDTKDVSVHVRMAPGMMMVKGYGVGNVWVEVWGPFRAIESPRHASKITHRSHLSPDPTRRLRAVTRGTLHVRSSFPSALQDIQHRRVYYRSSAVNEIRCDNKVYR